MKLDQESKSEIRLNNPDPDFDCSQKLVMACSFGKKLITQREKSKEM